MFEKTRYTVLLRTLVFVFRDDKLLMMKYSGKGGHQTKEKTDRKGIFNPIGGHVEAGEDIIQSAVREAREEAGITLLEPKLKGVINISGFAGKDMVNFIVVGSTKDQALPATLEGELQWANLDKIGSLKTFADIEPILSALLTLKKDQQLMGTARFDGFRLESLDIRAV